MSTLLVLHNSTTRTNAQFGQTGQLSATTSLTINAGVVQFTGGPGNLGGGTTATYHVGTVQFTGGPGALSAVTARVVHVYGTASVVDAETSLGEPVVADDSVNGGDSGTGEGGSGGGGSGGDPTLPIPQVAFDSYTGDTYRYFVFDILTDNILGELNLNDVSFSQAMGAVGEFSGNISTASVEQDIDLYTATAPGRTALYVLRDERAVWGGIIWDRSYSANSRTLSINAATWESYLFKRYMWHTYTTPTDWDQYEVVRQFFRHMRRDFKNIYIAEDNVVPVSDTISQAIDLFTATQPVNSGYAQPEKTYKRENMKTFGEVLTDFADNLNGFEWYFGYEYNKKSQRFRRRLIFLPTPPHLLPKGSPIPMDTEEDKPGIDQFVFEFPGNILTLDLEEDAQNAGTRQFVVGGTSVDAAIKPIGSWNNNGALNAGYPLFENVEASRHNDVAKLGKLNKLAAAYGRQTAPPIRNWTVTVAGNKDPVVGTYRLGHWCRLIINDPFVQQSLAASGQEYANGVVKRIMGYTVNVPTGSQLPETVTLQLEDDFFIPQESPGPNDEL